MYGGKSYDTMQDLPRFSYEVRSLRKGRPRRFPILLVTLFYVAPNIVGNVKIGSSFLWHGTFREKKELLERQMFWNSVEELEKNVRAHINYFTSLSHSNRKKHKSVRTKHKSLRFLAPLTSRLIAERSCRFPIKNIFMPIQHVARISARENKRSNS